MRILFLTFYFHPDLSAGSFRATALAEEMARQLGDRGTVDVVTTRPNRYHSFSLEAEPLETRAGLRIRRIPLPGHRSGMFDQALAFRAYTRGVIEATRGQDYDLVLGTSSRLMTARLSARIAEDHGVPLYLDIRDIFADTMKDVLPFRLGSALEPLLSIVERRTIRAASRVNLVSAGFACYFQKRYPTTPFSFFSNGVDPEFATEPVTAAPSPRVPGPIRIVYAGNMGEGQGLEHVVPDLAAILGSGISFRLIGDGGRKDRLAKALAARRIGNVELTGPMSRVNLLQAYREADVLFLHLNDYAAFNKVLPSKIFEYAALGKPIWAGVPGYSAEFLRREVRNAAVFSPCDVPAGVQAFSSLNLQTTPRPEFVEKFSRQQITRALASEVLALASGGNPR